MNIKTRVEQMHYCNSFWRIDLVIAEQFKAVIEKELENLKINTLILDLKEVTLLTAQVLELF